MNKNNSEISLEQKFLTIKEEVNFLLKNAGTQNSKYAKIINSFDNLEELLKSQNNKNIQPNKIIDVKYWINILYQYVIADQHKPNNIMTPEEIKSWYNAPDIDGGRNN